MTYREQVFTNMMLDHLNLSKNSKELEAIFNRMDSEIKSKPQAGPLNNTKVQGVYRLKSGKFIAKIVVDGVKIHLGTFEPHEFSLAVMARYKAEKGYTFNMNCSPAETYLRGKGLL